MPEPGLRDLKKARTRRHIADTATRLFAEKGYERVAVSEIARVAEVAEQTLYNYFPTKEHLVTDREQEISQRLDALIRTRTPGTTPAAAIRDFVLQTVAAIPDLPPELARGALGYLATISPAIHRLVLELTDRQATVLTAAISDTTDIAPEIARIQAMTLAGLFHIIITDTGRHTRDGRSPSEIATTLTPQLTAILTTLDHWQSTPPPTPS